MIHSMTGFGAGSFQVDGRSYEIEVRSVNHRHVDARVRLPRHLSSLEGEVRAAIQKRFGRGKFDLTILSPEGQAGAGRVQVDLDAAREYLRAAADLSRSDAVGGELEVRDLLGLPGVSRFVEPEVSNEALRDSALAAVDEALGSLESMRITEGETLSRDLESRLVRTTELAAEINSRAGSVQDAVRERLRKRARQLESETGLLDDARLHQEITIAADRLDITEEIVRLGSHVDQFRKLMAGAKAGEPVGRKLDFLLQELMREANTVGSKGSDAPIAHFVVDLKAELERLREQVQNVE